MNEPERDDVIEAARHHPARLHHRRVEGWIENVMTDFAIQHAQAQTAELQLRLSQVEQENANLKIRAKETMAQMKKKKSRRYELLKDKELRQEFLAEQIKVGLRFQLRSLRDSQNLTQGNLAELIGTKQSVISRLEKSPERVSLPTLIDIANALDVGVVVRFEQIDSVIDWYDNPTTIKMTPRTSEEVFNAPEIVQPVTAPSLAAKFTSIPTC